MSQVQPGGGILVSDFDGTMTRTDFFRLATTRLVPDDLPDYWDDYLAGRVSHFEVLRSIYGAIRVSEAEVLAALPDMGLDPALAGGVARLRRAGWQVIVASAGCEWYIRKLLAGCGVELEVHSNPGRFEPGRGLVLELPAGSPYFSPTHGIDKAAVVAAALGSGRPVAFAGDGFPDLPAARLVERGLRFARSDLARALRRERLPFRPFQRWSEVALALAGDVT
jgi:2,3-diketo-5-methylthio-1-phosphopentane phosphatase